MPIISCASACSFRAGRACCLSFILNETAPE
jgi:hypothetical protein